MAKAINSEMYVSHLNIRESISLLLLRIIALDILIFALINLIFYYTDQLPSNFPFLSVIISSSGFFFFFLSIAKILLTTYIVLQWLNEYYELWPKEIVHKKGFIFREIDRYSLNYVRTIKVQQGIIGKMFNFGTVSLVDFRHKKLVDLYLIHNPLRFVRIIERLVPNPNEEKTTIREHLFDEDNEQ